ncbi:tRNA (N(6)-L-threonylcarbamoyladenosine(37)-C(2))-methylthiotransferase MtaB [soil metagenome]
MKTVALHTLGCKLNYSETSAISKQFEDKGFKILEYGKSSDFFVLNTCSVTENADKECRQIVRSIIRQNPDTYVIVTGCYAQLQPDEIAKINGVDLVLGANEKFKLFDHLDNSILNDPQKNLTCTGNVSVFRSDISEVKDFTQAFTADTDSRTRAFLKIQDGCSYKCSFCTIPLARGSSRSQDISGVIDNAKKILDSGYKEIILTGVNTGDFNYNGKKLIDVLYELERLPVERIRISSIEPNLLTEEIITLAASSEKFCHHFHIPLQSGDDEILSLMRRRYRSDFYKDLIFKIKDKMPDAGIGVDVIVGFPGESDSHFNNTYSFLSSLPVSYLHTFSYSERRDTYAITLPGSVEVRKRKLRSKMLRSLSEKLKENFYFKYLYSEQDVLFESKKQNGFYEGFTSNYIRVKMHSEEDLENKVVKVKLTESDGANSVTVERINSLENSGFLKYSEIIN